MAETTMEAVNGSVAKADSGTCPDAMRESVSKPMPPAVGEKPIESPIRPISITIIVGHVSIIRRDTARTRIIDIAREAGVSSGRTRLGFCGRATQHDRGIVDDG
jgi:hypothetical protein